LRFGEFPACSKVSWKHFEKIEFFDTHLAGPFVFNSMSSYVSKDFLPVLELVGKNTKIRFFETYLS
jgi:hypothetical protein